MLSVYVREQKPYERKELQKLLELDEGSFLSFAGCLGAYGLLKLVSARNDKEEEPAELAAIGTGGFSGGQEPDAGMYAFTFVGILQAGNRILKCCPKYIEKEEPIGELKQILKVLRRYQSRSQGISIYEPGGREESFNRLAVMLYLVEDYLENGVYTNWQPVTEVNGSGEILWDQTIHETLALMVGNRPFYPELLTRGSNADEHDYFRRLHRCIVTECSQSLEDAGLTELLELERLYESDESLEDLGDEDYILDRIRRELDVRFDDRRRMILKLMDAYIAHRQMPETGSGLCLFGTDHFEHVWEAVCAETLRNCLHRPLGALMAEKRERYGARGFGKEKESGRPAEGSGLERAAFGEQSAGSACGSGAGHYGKSQTLLNLIEKPRWRYRNTGDTAAAKRTLVPDLITIYDRGGQSCFAILDAKYYRICLERGRVSGQPGISDITKQYLYQLAYQDFIRDMGYDCVQNIFLFPGCGAEAEYLGRAELAMLAAAGRTGLSHIAAVRLPATRLYDAYLAGREEEPGSLLACVPEDGEIEPEI